MMNFGIALRIALLQCKHVITCHRTCACQMHSNTCVVTIACLSGLNQLYTSLSALTPFETTLVSNRESHSESM